MISVSQYQDQTAAVLGLGRAGIAAARALMAGGAEVWAWDDAAAARDRAEAAGVPLVDLTACDWSRPAALVISPGIPHTHPAPHPAAAAAKAAGCPITGEVELLYRTQIAATFVGITGTNGKSTTTALVGHLLRTAGRRAEIGGNLGTPALALEPLGDGEAYVLEMSSYQLDLVERTIFDVAVLLNLSPDHLDRHGGLEGYVAAKMHIFDHQDEDCTAVIGVDDARSRALFDQLHAAGEQRLVPVSGQRQVEGGIYALGGILHDEHGPVLDLTTDAPTLPGTHNHQNAAAAFAVGRTLGLDRTTLAEGLRSYPGLPHRQELVAEIEGIRFVNDSKATNADAAGRALASYDSIYWILGGRAKEGGLAGTESGWSRVRHAFLIGEAEATFAAVLDGHIPTSRCQDLDRAVAAAFETARGEGRPGAVVLLSPACASFDQYPDFEARGDAFRRIVEGLA